MWSLPSSSDGGFNQSPNSRKQPATSGWDEDDGAPVTVANLKKCKTSLPKGTEAQAIPVTSTGWKEFQIKWFYPTKPKTGTLSDVPAVLTNPHKDVDPTFREEVSKHCQFSKHVCALACTPFPLSLCCLPAVSRIRLTGTS